MSDYSVMQLSLFTTIPPALHYHFRYTTIYTHYHYTTIHYYYRYTTIHYYFLYYYTISLSHYYTTSTQTKKKSYNKIIIASSSEDEAESLNLDADEVKDSSEVGVNQCDGSDRHLATAPLTNNSHLREQNENTTKEDEEDEEDATVELSDASDIEMKSTVS